MNFRSLLESHPEVTQDRHSLAFSRGVAPDDIARAFARHGVVMLKEALPHPLLETARCAFAQFLHTGEVGPRNDVGSWHSPWQVRDGKDFPAATVLAGLIGSWVWEVVEEICQSSTLVVLLKFCTARHTIDKLLGVGGHQDAKVVDADVPLSIWIPLQDIVPGANSGLGFVVPHAHNLLPTLPHDDVGADYVLRDPSNLWIPPYKAGDLTIHSRLSAHFTTGYGTLTERYSLEVRAMPRRTAPPAHLDPALYVARRNGRPTIVEAVSSPALGAAAFIDALRMDPVLRSR
jgi:hypothetical protein